MRYVFLGKGDTLPVIIASDFNMQQVECLVEVLRGSREILGGLLRIIFGSLLIFFSHKMQFMPDHKPIIEHRRCLNPPMQEVVKKEIIKWLDAEVIYPIGDSSWVCHVQCVP